MALPTRFWNSWTSCISSARTVGQRIVRHQRAAVLDGAAQIHQRLLQRLFAGGIEQLLSFCPDARIGQQILDQPLHAAGAVDGEGDEFVGIGVQLALVAPGQQLRVTGHHAQRLLQVVRGDVGKLPQFLIRTIQLLHLLQQVRFGLLAGGDVADGRGHQNSLGAFQRAQHDLDRKLAAILPPPDEFDPGADLLRQRVFGGAKSVGDQPFREAFRNDVLHLLPQEFVAAVSELFFRLNVQQDDFSALVHHHHGIRSRLPAVRGIGLPSAPDAFRRLCAR